MPRRDPGEERDRKMVADLDEARLEGANEKDGHYDWEAKAAAFADEFRSFGIDARRSRRPEAASRIRSSKIAEALIAALDEWAYSSTSALREHLDSIARAADPGPESSAIRDAISRKDAAALRRLVETEEARRKLGNRSRIVLKALADLDPASSRPLLEEMRREQPADFWLNHDLAVANLHLNRPQIETAIRYYTAAVALRPTSPGAHLNLGSALYKKGQLDEAIACFRQAIRLRPDYANAHNNLGAMLDKKGLVEDAIEAYRRAIRLRPDFAEAYQNLGFRLNGLGRLDEAIDASRHAIRLRPDLGGAYIILGSGLGQKGQLDEAVERLPPGGPAPAQRRGGPLQPRQCARQEGPARRGHRIPPAGDPAPTGRSQGTLQPRITLEGSGALRRGVGAPQARS